ncbi:Peroxisomal membrane protein pex16 [Saitoella coloradoensis]
MAESQDALLQGFDQVIAQARNAFKADLSELKKENKELRKVNARLEFELEEKGQQVERANTLANGYLIQVHNVEQRLGNSRADYEAEVEKVMQLEKMLMESRQATLRAEKELKESMAALDKARTAPPPPSLPTLPSIPQLASGEAAAADNTDWKTAYEQLVEKYNKKHQRMLNYKESVELAMKKHHTERRAWKKWHEWMREHGYLNEKGSLKEDIPLRDTPQPPRTTDHDAVPTSEHGKDEPTSEVGKTYDPNAVMQMLPSSPPPRSSPTLPPVELAEAEAVAEPMEDVQVSSSQRTPKARGTGVGSDQTAEDTDDDDGAENYRNPQSLALERDIARGRISLPPAQQAIVVEESQFVMPVKPEPHSDVVLPRRSSLVEPESADLDEVGPYAATTFTKTAGAPWNPITLGSSSPGRPVEADITPRPTSKSVQPQMAGPRGSDELRKQVHGARPLQLPTPVSNVKANPRQPRSTSSTSRLRKGIAAIAEDGSDGIIHLSQRGPGSDSQLQAEDEMRDMLEAPGADTTPRAAARHSVFPAVKRMRPATTDDANVGEHAGVESDPEDTPSQRKRRRIAAVDTPGLKTFSSDIDPNYSPHRDRTANRPPRQRLLGPEVEAENKGRGRYAKSVSRPTMANQPGVTDFVVNPAVNNGVSFAYAEVERSREARKRLHGSGCPCCTSFYELAGMQPLPTHAPRWRSPSPQAAPNPEFMSKEEVVLAHMKEVSRHRAAMPKAKSPPGFWESDFPTTQEENRYKEEAEKRRMERLKIMEAEANKKGGRWIRREDAGRHGSRG